MPNEPSFPRLRPSVSQKASRQAEIDRVRRMTVEERVKAALGMAARFAAADTVIRSGSRLRIVLLPHLVALKLYAGGTKSHADIVELLSRNPDADFAALRDLCRSWRLRGLDPLIEEATGKP